MIFRVLLSLSILAFIQTGTDADLFSSRLKRQTMGGGGMGGTCPIPGGCNCICNCPGGGGGNCPPCPTTSPTMMTPTMTTGGGGNGNMTMTPPTGGPPSQDTCFALIRAAANLSTGQLLGLLLTTLLSNLVMPILQIVLTGNNTLEGAVLPLANILCYIVGLLLLVLRSLGALGLLGMGGLLQNILGGGIG